MARILCIETSSVNCSVALFKEDRLIAIEESSESYAHSEKLHPFIKKVIEKAECSIGELDAIMVGSGPGSFTGLRIGVSAAKGLCYAKSIPLMSFSSLKNLAYSAKSLLEKKEIDNTLVRYLPLIDARRMEAYHAIFDADLNEVEIPSPIIMDENTFLKELDKGPVVFVGDGSNKIMDFYKSHSNAIFIDKVLPTSRVMGHQAKNDYHEKNFEDVAYFEPFYLKNFQPTTPKKKV